MKVSPNRELSPERTHSSPEEGKSSGTAQQGLDLKTIGGLKEYIKKKYTDKFQERASQIEAGISPKTDSPSWKIDSLLTEYTVK